MARLDDYTKHVIAKCYEYDEIVPLEDGYQYFWIKNRGALSANVLRIIADELDRRNKKWDEQVQREFSKGEKMARLDAYTEVIIEGEVYCTRSNQDICEQEEHDDFDSVGLLIDETKLWIQTPKGMFQVRDKLEILIRKKKVTDAV